MAPKNSNNSERKTRNSSRGRSPTREPRPAASHSTKGGPQLSPPSSETLPAGKVNKDGVPSEVFESAPPSSSGIRSASTETPINSYSLALSKGSAIRPELMEGANSVTTQTEGTMDEVSDNEEDSDELRKALASPGKTLLLVLSELKEIKTTMGTIKKIEETTASISKELSVISSRTAKLEEAHEATSAKVRVLGDDVSALKSATQKHEHSISALQEMKEDIFNSNNKKVGEMERLLGAHKEQVQVLQATADQIKQDLSGAQKEQVEELHSTAKQIKQDISVEVDKKIERKFEQLAQESHFQSLREQAFDKRFNLVIVGLAEDEQKSTQDLVLDFWKSSLNIQNIEFSSASRVGPAAEGLPLYPRPILVKFGKINHRNRIWKKRQMLLRANEGQQVRIQADLPKELKEGVRLLYTVRNAAIKFERFKSAKVFNYQLELNGEVFQPAQLENLPLEIRPSTLASPRSESCLAFFSKRSVLSNHHPSEFVINDQKYFTVEHYLAVKRAAFSNNQEMIRKAASAKDPRQAKYVLNVLKEDRADEWYAGIDNVLLEALRAKFEQNPHLRSFLRDTNDLLLGEASRDPRWGIGMTLENPEVLNSSLWYPEGNLLGRALMRVRAEIQWDSC